MSKTKTAVYLLLLTLWPHTSFSDTLQDRYKDMTQAQVQMAHAATQGLGAQAQTYDMLTYNVGLLNGWLAKVPFYEDRSKLFIKEIEKYTHQHSTDVIYLQELWYAHDRQALKDWAEAHGYVSINATIDSLTQEKKHLFHNPAQTGLEILVKKSIIKEIKYVGFQEYLDQNGGNVRALFESVAWADPGFGQEIKRGSLGAVIQLISGQSLSLFTTHLTPLTDNNSIRLTQLRALQKNAHTLNSAYATNLSFIGADFNLSPLWENEIGGAMDGTPEAWNQNAESYYTFLKEAGFIDTFAVSQPLGTPGYTQDRVLNHLTEMSSSTKTEPEQRLDYLLVKSTVPYKILTTEVVMDEPIEASQKLFLSDHFGVSLSIRF